MSVEVPGVEPGSECLDSRSATSVGPGGLSGRRTPEPDARRPYATQVSRSGGVAVAGTVEPDCVARPLTSGGGEGGREA